MPVIHSFDVFDTALVRRVAFPTDIFRLVARSLAGRSAETALTEFEEAFVSARIAAEQIARTKATPSEDCTLEAIWFELRRLLPTLSADASHEAEVVVERENIVANPNLAPRIRALQAAGERVIFISDIFHTRKMVFQLLEAAGLASDIEQVYVSSEAGLLKATGRLFPYVAEREGVTTADLLHVGDNPGSDGRAARAQGVRASVYTATRLNAAEQVLLSAFGSDMAGSRMAAAMRLTRLALQEDGRAGLVSAYLGPVAVLQAAWALRQAQARGIGRLYFIARDGHVPWRAAVMLESAFPGVECRYVKLSRHSLLAAMPQLGEFGVFWIERSWSKRSVSEIAALVGHSWDDIANHVTLAIPHAARDYLLSSSDEMRRFVQVLDNLATGGNNRQRATDGAAALRYMRNEGLLDDVPFLLFDVGWHLSMQAAVKALLEQHGASGFAGGLYLGILCNGRIGEALAGPARALLYEKPYAPDLVPRSNTVFERMILVEHLMGLAPHGSAKGYVTETDPDTPMPVEGPIMPDREAVVRQISGEIDDFAALLSPYAAEFGEENVTRRTVEALTNHFFASPAAYDLSHLDALDVESDLGARPRMRITEPWRLSTVLLQAIPYRVRTRMKLSHGPTLWPEASLARSGVIPRRSMGALRTARRMAAQLLRRGR